MSTAPRWSPWTRVAIVFVVAVAAWWLTYQGLDRWFGPVNQDRSGHAVRAVLTVVLGTAIVLAACRYLDRRTLAELGLRRRSGLGDLVLGFAGWLVPTLLLVSLAGGSAELGVSSPLEALGVGAAVLLAVADTAYRVVVFGMFALVCGVLRATTGWLWTSIGFHLAFQTTEQTLTSTTVLTLEPPAAYVTAGAVAFFLLPVLSLVWSGVRVSR